MEWKLSQGLTEYPHALEGMAARVAAIQKGEAEELCWLVEHPPLYTLGTSAKTSDVLILSPLGGGSGWGHHFAETVPHNGPLPTSPLQGEELTPFPVYPTGRGGQVTYHGPGQRVVYLMLDLKKRARLKGAEPDLRAYVQQLEQWIILTLAQFGIEGFTREGRVGVWVEGSPVTSFQSPVASHQSPVASDGAARSVAPSPLAGEGWDGGAISAAPFSPPLTQPSPARGEGFSSASVPSTTHHSLRTTHEKKIAALGVRVQKWVTSHGIAINVHPDLSHYAGIVPCGIREFGVTSMRAMGVDVGMDALDAALRENFVRALG